MAGRRILRRADRPFVAVWRPVAGKQPPDGAIALYAKSITLGVSWSWCFLRRPTLIIGFWAAVAAIGIVWLFVPNQRLPVG